MSPDNHHSRLMSRLYDKKASRSATVWLYAGCAYLIVQFFVLAKMVWVDFNWDIMEPVTYFVTLGTLIGGYIFFVFAKKDYTYLELENRMTDKKLRKLYLANRFNWQQWNAVRNRIQELRVDLKLPAADI